MCRIAGIVALGDGADNTRKVTTMTNAMKHGGPDDHGVFQHETVTLGHRRLSIIDLSSAGHQPMTDSSGDLVISYNGEIYNYKEIRADLIKLGVQFRTSTDTEVIFQSYKTWGVKGFGRFLGIFAFALYDKHTGKLLLVRDSPGVKPMYYHATSDRIVFASEVKAFKALDPQWEENRKWRSLFLAFGYLAHPVTTLKDVVALAPGSVLEVDVRTMKTSVQSFIAERATDNSEEALDRVKRTVMAALRRNIISDAPLGIFLSGGIDSSLLALLAAQEIAENERTVSVTFEEAAFDESPYQQIVLEKIRQAKHSKFLVNEGMFWDSIDTIWQAMDQPTIDGVNSYFVSMAAHKAGLKAVLSGLGADELFGGYASSSRTQWLPYLRSLPAKDLAAAIAGNFNHAYKRLSFLRLNNSLGDYLFLRGVHTPKVISQLLQCDEREVWDDLRSLQEPVKSEIPKESYASFLEYNYYMKGQLLKDTDFMSMWFGLEARVPFLDQELIHVAATTITTKAQQDSRPKYLLTKAFEDVLPNEIVFRKKQGFTFPFHVWLRNKMNNGDRLLPARLASELPVDNFMKGKAHWSQVWSGVVLDQFRWK